MVELGTLPAIAAMTLRSNIERAFAHREKPTKIIDERDPITPEQKDALWFSGKNWRDVQWQDWDCHSDAFFALCPSAFIYYLPSVLISGLVAPEGRLLAADALIGVLDRSPEVYHWDSFMASRLVGLEPQEYAVMQEWILSRSGLPDGPDEDTLTRCYETVDFLAKESALLRGLLKIE